MSARPTIYSADAIRLAVAVDDLIAPMSEAFRLEAEAAGDSTISVLTPRGEDGDVHVKAAWLPTHPWFVIKVATGFTIEEGGRRTQPGGYLALHDAYDGTLDALLVDEHHLTDLRTAAASVAATAALAPAAADSLAVLGTGTQARLQALATARIRPVTRVSVWGRRREAAERLAAAISAEAPHLRTVVAATARDAVEPADIVLTATSSRAPIVRGSWLHPGQHITATGADDPTKVELDPECFGRADIIAVDSPRHTPRVAGDLLAATTAGAIDRRDVSALGVLPATLAEGGRDVRHLSIAKLVGTATQDLLTAEIALRRLTAGDRDSHRTAGAAEQR